MKRRGATRGDRRLIANYIAYFGNRCPGASERRHRPHAINAESGLLTIDHIVPLDKGGANNRANKRILCYKENYAKGSYLPSNEEMPLARETALAPP